jgi:hypothetical protein
MTGETIPDELLDQRARELALPPAPPQVETMVLAAGRTVRVAVPLAELAGICPLTAIARVPGTPAHVLGLSLLLERRLLVVDLDTLLRDVPPRPRERPGYAVVLRRAPVALAVEQALGLSCVLEVWQADGLRLVAGVSSDGTLTLDLAAVVDSLSGAAP